MALIGVGAGLLKGKYFSGWGRRQRQRGSCRLFWSGINFLVLLQRL